MIRSNALAPLGRRLALSTALASGILAIVVPQPASAQVTDHGAHASSH